MPCQFCAKIRNLFGLNWLGVGARKLTNQPVLAHLRIFISSERGIFWIHNPKVGGSIPPVATNSLPAVLANTITSRCASEGCPVATPEARRNPQPRGEDCTTAIQVGVCPKGASGCAVPVYDASRVEAETLQATHILLSAAADQMGHRRDNCTMAANRSAGIGPCIIGDRPGECTIAFGFA